MQDSADSRSLWQRRISRRNTIRGGLAAVGAALAGGAMGGCTGSSEQSSVSSSLVSTTTTGKPAAAAASTPAPRRGGTVTLSIVQQMSDLHPQTGSDSSLLTNRYVYDHLFHDDYINGRRELSLAQSMENPDPLTYIFKIKPTAKFQNKPPVNGRAVTSIDMAASWDAFVANPRTYNKKVFEDVVDRYQTPDPSTVVLKMKEPNAWVLSGTSLGAPLVMAVIPKEIIDRNQMETVAIGPGAYVLEQFDPASEISFVRRPDGWHTGDARPYVDRYVHRVITDSAARAAAFKAKQIDALGARDKLEAEEFKSFGADVVIEREFSRPAQFWMRADSTGGLFSDVRVREAVYCAWNMPEILDLVELGEGQMSGPIHPELRGWALPPDELKKQFPYDVQKAKQLLTAANWNSNQEIELRYPAREKDALLCQILQKQLAAVGIKTKLTPQDYNTIWLPQTAQKKDFQLAATAGYNWPKTPDAALISFTTAAGGNGSVTRWGDPEVDALVAKQQLEFDVEKQRQIIFDAQRLILKKFNPRIVLYQPYAFSARWGYYHPSTRDQNGDVGIFGHYTWTERG